MRDYLVLAIVLILALTALIFVWKMPRDTPFMDWWRERRQDREERQDEDGWWRFFDRKDEEKEIEDQDFWEPYENYRRRWFYRGDVYVLRSN